ncbi:MAG: recombinase family protein [Methanoculleus marisnigri]|nr:recombinase family protein [Methanoculleus marisnigri]
MVEYVEQHKKITDVLFDVTDRMARNFDDMLVVRRLVSVYGKRVHFYRIGRILDKNWTPEDLFNLAIEVAVSEKSSLDTSRRAKMGMAEKVSQGHFAGTAPLGYVNYINDSRLKRIKPDEAKARFIRRAFELMASGNYSILSLADRLYKEGLRTKKGNKVKKSTMAQILNNPIYHGQFRWKSGLHEGKHQPIISKSLFDRVQEIMNGRYNRVRVTKRNFPFSGVARCSVCNCTILGELKKGRYVYYHCGFSNGRHEAQYIPSAQMPELFLDAVQAVTLDENRTMWLERVIEHNQKSETDFREQRLTALTREKARLENRLSRLYDSLFDGAIDEQILQSKQTEYADQLATVSEEIAGLSSDRSDAVQHAFELLELCKRLYDVYNEVEDEKKAQLLRIIGSNYSLEGRSVCVTYNKPFDFLANLPPRIKKLPVCNPLHNRSPLGCQSESAYHSTSYQRACRSGKPEAVLTWISSLCLTTTRFHGLFPDFLTS